MNFHRFSIPLAIIVLLYSTSSAQYLPGAKQIALSHSDVASISDVFAVFTNPAGLSKINSLQLGVYYSPSPFGLKQLANGFGGITESFKFGKIAAGFSTYGFELYKENKLSISFAKNIYENFSAGVSVFYHSLSIKNYGSDNTISFSIGLITNLTNQVKLGFSADNITRSTYGNESNQIPSIFRSGISYSPEKVFTLNLALEKDIDNPLSLRFGLEYQPVKFIDLRLGFMDEPSSFSGGAGINYLNVQIDYALFTHQDLGLTHQAGLIITF